MKVLQNRHFLLGNLKGITGLVFFLLLIPVIAYAGQQAIKFLSQAAPVPASIVVDAARSQANLSRPWEGLSQGGELEKDGSLVSLAPVSAAVRSLDIKYIRIDHVLDRPYKVRISEIVSAGATPFVSISYFPGDVADKDVGTVNNWSAWQAKVTALVEDISGKSGMNISGVYYEIWNEPDGPGFGAFNIGTGKDYWQLYQKTLEAVLAAKDVNSFKVGGPALADLRRCTNGLLFICNQFWLDRFLSLVSQNHLRLDFISWHRYSFRMEDYNEDVNFILKLYNKYPNLPPTEKIISEWGSDPARNPIHGAVLDAAHLVTAARTFTGHVSLATKFEVRDGPASLGDTGWGIISYQGQTKPIFAALRLLSLLRSERILLSGEGTNVTGIASRDSSGTTVIISNYDRWNSYTAIVPVRIINLKPGFYHLIKYQINSLYPQGKNDTLDLNLRTGVLDTQETMLPNSILLYDLREY